MDILGSVILVKNNSVVENIPFSEPYVAVKLFKKKVKLYVKNWKEYGMDNYLDDCIAEFENGSVQISWF